MWRDDAYLLDILLAARRVLRFCDGVTRAEFLKNEILQNAVMRPIQIVGEAARKISPEFKAAHPEIPWTGMIGLRNKLVHEYFRVDLERVWDVIEADIPPLVPMIEPLVPPPDPEG
ncbi:MAG: DUF86 domain-containing protein [Candidatus Methylomirabilis sp.]|nr:DUF86 domain-containing protein [Deltaproteobacteria bacterium]